VRIDKDQRYAPYMIDPLFLHYQTRKPLLPYINYFPNRETHTAF